MPNRLIKANKHDDTITNNNEALQYRDAPAYQSKGSRYPMQDSCRHHVPLISLC